MATSKPYKQDLPPKGGYAPVTFKRIPAKQLFSGMNFNFKHNFPPNWQINPQKLDKENV